uniref:Putative terminase n=1 Tax=viral metagenome TaxID=1070528 RepID=A0A6M3J0D8_9ZZZZ
MTSMRPNRDTFIIGHERASTNTLYNMARLMHQMNPIAPSTLLNDREKGLYFDTADGQGLKSGYKLATAENVDAGRSQGIHYLHDSEESSWRDARTLLDGVLQCVPDPPSESEVFRESTANGFGNAFQEDIFKTYCEGKYPYYEEDGITYAWHNPESDWVLVFIGWYVHERYTMDFDSEEEKELFRKKVEEKVFDKESMSWTDSEEIKLMRKYRLTLEQLKWREWAIENKCSGSKDKFRQEYPADVIEAFLSQGSNVFGKELCDELEIACEKPLLTADITRIVGKPRFKISPYGKVNVWEKVDKDETYFITVDTAGGKKEGFSKSKDEREPDRTNIDVWNHRTGKQVAQWNGHISYDLIADLVMMIGEMYNLAPACVELNNHGFSVVSDLTRENYPQFFNENRKEAGWLSTSRTKPLMVDTLYKMARDVDIKIMSKETVNEMRTFVEESGRYGASSGCKDDRVITAALASQMMILLPKKFNHMRGNKRKDLSFSNWSFKNQNAPKTDYFEVYV